MYPQYKQLVLAEGGEVKVYLPPRVISDTFNACKALRVKFMHQSKLGLVLPGERPKMGHEPSIGAACVRDVPIISEQC